MLIFSNIIDCSLIVFYNKFKCIIWRKEFMSFLEKNENFNRNLTIEEKTIFTFINPKTNHPNFPQANTDTIRFLAKGGEYTNDPNSPLCEQYQCINKNTLIYLYNKSSGQYISQLTNYDHNTIKNLCENERFECVGDVQYYATYNCIGWAIGVTKWVDPSDITAYVEAGFSITEAINSFLDDKAKLYETSLSNILHIVDDLNSIIRNNIKLNNNTVAFYFNNNNEFLHGARYVETLLEEEPIYKWTSKLGRSILITHELDDLRGEYSMYGNNIAYAVIIGIEDQSRDYYEL